MLRNLYLDGKPDELKGSCPVWDGGKSGDNIKGLPIVIASKGGTDSQLLRGNLEAFQKVGRHPDSHHPKCEGPSCLAGSVEHF